MCEHEERPMVNAGVSFLLLLNLFVQTVTYWALLRESFTEPWAAVSVKLTVKEVLGINLSLPQETEVQVCISQFLYGCQRSELRSACSHNTHFTHWPTSLAKYSILSVKKKKKAKYFIAHLFLSLENGKIICTPNELSENKFLYDSLVLTRLDLHASIRMFPARFNLNVGNSIPFQTQEKEESFWGTAVLLSLHPSHTLLPAPSCACHHEAPANINNRLKLGAKRNPFVL